MTPVDIRPKFELESTRGARSPMKNQVQQDLSPRSHHPLPTCLFVGGSKTTVTRRLPQAGHMRRDSNCESGKFGPRVATSVSRSSCFRAVANQDALGEDIDEFGDYVRCHDGDGKSWGRRCPSSRPP
jgi:hypothetical protein